MLPSFFIVGPPRTGTSWLHEVLKNYASLPTSTKETRFFDVNFHRGLRWYQAHYPLADSGRQAGEIAPTYFASGEARERISSLIPTAKIVCIFRNPVDRLVSLYRVKRAYGLIPWDEMEEALLRDDELMESSKYATHFAEWQQAFGSGRVLAAFYDDLVAEPQAFVDRLANFIEVPRFRLSATELRVVHTSENMTHPRSYYRTRHATFVANWLKARRFGKFVSAVKRSPLGKLFLGGGSRFAAPSPDLALTICRLFQPEVDMLERMLGRDLSDWKQVREFDSNSVLAGESVSAETT